MNSRNVIGKRIMKVQQCRFWNENLQQWMWEVNSIVLDDGTRIDFEAGDGSGAEPAVYGEVVRPERAD